VARLSLKPDSSFFRKITIGAVGARAVAQDLAERGHSIAELERGSLDTKLWKDVKRKQVRIPDLVCTRCGVRVESRAKTKPDLSMSHSEMEVSRSWDFGMVDNDLIAFPVCSATEEAYASAGQLGPESSYWHERNWVRWKSFGWVNYFTVRKFRAAPHTRSSTKGVTEGSELFRSWGATFSTRTGTVEAVQGEKVTVARSSDGHRYTWTIRPGQTAVVAPGETVEQTQVLASSVSPIPSDRLSCAGELPADHIGRLLSSRERTQRFTGLKLARLRGEPPHRDEALQLIKDEEEDVYVRLEGVAYLAAVCNESVRELMLPYLRSADEQTQLEATITLGETATPEAVALLSEILDDAKKEYFLRSAAAWGLSRIGSEVASERLKKAFSDVDLNIRQEALDGIVAVGGPTVRIMAEGLKSVDTDIAAGCAEALRQQERLPNQIVDELVTTLRTGRPSQWLVWLVGHLPRERVNTAIADLQDRAPELHYAVTLIWAFVDSWVARRWELRRGPGFPEE